MFNWFTKIFLLVSTLLVLSGCTSELWKVAAGKEETVSVSVRKVLGASKSESADRVSVCMVLFDHETQKESEVTLQIPLVDKSSWNVREYRTVSSIQRTAIEYRPALSDLKPGCLVDKTPMPLLQFDENEFWKQAKEQKDSRMIELDKHVTEAVYVVNRYNMPETVGYVSAKPIVENGYTITVPVFLKFNYSVKRDAKPYLVILTPVTVALDVVAVTAAVIVLSPICFDAGSGCSGKFK